MLLIRHQLAFPLLNARQLAEPVVGARLLLFAPAAVGEVGAEHIFLLPVLVGDHDGLGPLDVPDEIALLGLYYRLLALLARTDCQYAGQFTGRAASGFLHGMQI